MEELNGLLDRMLAKAKAEAPLNTAPEIIIDYEKGMRICSRYTITPGQLYKAVEQYCNENDINLVQFDEVTEGYPVGKSAR